MNQSRSKRQIVVLDCCYSALFDSRSLQEVTLKDAEELLSTSSDVHFNPERNQGRFIITATDGQALALERIEGDAKSPNAIFTTALLSGLRSQNARDDLGNVTVQSLYRYLKSEVAEISEGKQSPKLIAFAGDGDLVLIPGSNKSIPVAILNKLNDSSSDKKLLGLLDIEDLMEEPFDVYKAGIKKELEKLIKDDSKRVERKSRSLMLQLVHGHPGSAKETEDLLVIESDKAKGTENKEIKNNRTGLYFSMVERYLMLISVLTLLVIPIWYYYSIGGKAIESETFPATYSASINEAVMAPNVSPTQLSMLLNLNAELNRGLSLTESKESLKLDQAEFIFNSVLKYYPNNKLASDGKTKIRKQREKNSIDESKNDELLSPIIEIIDPVITLIDGKHLIRAEQSGATEIVGKVQSQWGVKSFTINDRSVELDEYNLFWSTISSEDRGSSIVISATDTLDRTNTVELYYDPSLSKEPIQHKLTAEVLQHKFRTGETLPLGKYYALIITNSQYQEFDNLELEADDANRLTDVLSKKYGFEVLRLHNASRYKVLSALNGFREVLTEQDNLLVFYSGRSDVENTNKRCYWLPVDAESNNTGTWISSLAINDMLYTMAAKHVLVIADACVGPRLSESAVVKIDDSLGEGLYYQWVSIMSQTRARLALSTNEPSTVQFAAANKQQTFTQNLISALANNDGLMEGYNLFRRMSKKDKHISYAPITYSGHEAGEFFFISTGSKKR
tara:strand:- start:3282 stop:5486 length:2205 start_codon:yes stop_codon:yes gene_type:complete